jgi:hypothetical protein
MQGGSCNPEWHAMAYEVKSERDSLSARAKWLLTACGCREVYVVAGRITSPCAPRMPQEVGVPVERASPNLDPAGS